MTDQNDAEKPTEQWVNTDAPVGSAERIREAGIVDQQGVVADEIGRSDDE
jgi:hypothetical protein